MKKEKATGQTSQWQSHYFKRIFKTVLIGTSVVLLTALSLLYATFYHTTLSYLSGVNQRFMDSIVANIRYQTNSSYENALNAYTSTSGTILMASTAAKETEKLRAMRDIDYFIMQDPLVHSVYFYNADTDRIYTFGYDLLQSDLDTFFDREIVEILRDPALAPSVAFPRAVSNSCYTSDTSEVSTRILYTSGGDAVVVNLLLDQVFGILQETFSSYTGVRTGYCVFYEKSEPVYSSNMDDLLQNGKIDTLQAALDKHNWDGTFSGSLNGQNYQISVLDNPETHCQLVSIVAQNEIATSFLDYAVLFIVIAALGSLLAILINLKISSKLYAPIDNLTKILPDAPAQKPQDEIGYIQQSIQQTVSRLETLFEYREKHLSSNQSALLKQQLLYNRYSDDAFWENCRQQEFPFHPGDQFILMYACWDKTVSGPSFQDDQRMLCYALSNVFHELLDDSLSILDIPFENSGIAFLCSFENLPDTGKVDTVLHGIQDTFRQYFDLSLSFFISNPMQNPSQLYSSMQQLKEMARYQYFWQGGVILQAGDFDPESRSAELPTLPDISRLESALRSSDRDACTELLDAYFDTLQQYTFEAVQASVNMFASRLIAIMKKMQENQPTFPSIDYHDFFSTVTAAHSLYSVREAVQAPLDQIMEYMSSSESETANLLADEVVRYLKQNYADYNLSSKSIAQEHHISVPYLNRLFKQKTGKTIALYLKQLRLESARRMLTDTNLSVEAIARRVGFENTKYFYTLFKNEFGVSPSNYRISRSIIDSPDDAEQS